MKNNNKPALDLTYAYGETIRERLSRREIEKLREAKREAERKSTGDTTVRTVTSLFVGTRKISGLAEWQEMMTSPDSKLCD
jgi:hypothetical protein